tara:strand:+ start:2393 stop:6487 length:4095 start_codon:yes stop_codon:yes gene_type:complete
MKWIGQHIYDLVSRFRDDFYLEGLETSTETDIVVIDSEGKVSKRAASGFTSGTATLASTVTVTDSTTNTGFPVVFHDESNALLDDTGAFIYNPSTGRLTVPNLTVSGDAVYLNTETLTVEDKNIVLNYNGLSDTSSTADGAGITIQDAVDASNDASLTWTAADDTFEFSHAVEINNGASGGTSALIIDNDDVDQIALDINASNTTANVVDISATAVTTANIINVDSNSLTTGSAINIDVDDALTTTTEKLLAKIDYDKAGVTADNEENHATALDISMVDAATNHSGSEVNHKGVAVAISAASNQGTINQTGFSATLSGGDIHSNTVGYYSNTSGASGGAGVDFKAVSAANTNDFFSIATQANGFTEISTADADAALAHMWFHVDGNTWFHTADTHATNLGAVVGDGVGDSPYFEVSGHHGTSSRLRLYERGGSGDTDYFEILTATGGATTLTTVDAAAAAAHFEIAADGNITLDPAGTIALEADSLIEGNLRIGGSSDTSNNWITIDAQNGTDTTGGGICFYETGTDTIGAPQYGAKIVYNEDDDEFAIGTMNNGVFQRQIYMHRSWDNIKLADAAYIEGTTPTLGFSDTSTTVVDTDVLGTIYWSNSDDGSTTARMQAVATEDHASGANGGTKLEFKTTPNTTSTEATALTIGQDQSLTVAGDLTVNGDSLIFESSDDSEPVVQIKNTNSNTSSAELHFVKDKGAAGADGDELGIIKFYGDDAGQTQTVFGHIKGAIATAADGSEGGSIKLAVASHDGELQNGLQIIDGDAEDEIDVTIGSGTNSLTTIVGDLTVSGGNATINGGDTTDAILKLATNTASASDDVIIELVTDEDGTPRQARIGVDHSDNTLKLVHGSGFSGGTNGICVDSSGNVGLGTASPEAHLHLESAGDTAIIVRADVGNSGEDDNPLIHLQQDFVAAGASGVMVDGKLGIVGNAGQIMSNSIANSTYITAQGGGSSPNVSMQFGTGGNNGQDTDHAAVLPTARMTILHGGNIGIGVNDPDSLLEIYGTSTQLKLSYNASDYATLGTGSNGDLTITTVDAASANAHFEVAADGNIILDAALDIALESGGGDVTSDAQNFTISNSTSHKPVLKLQGKADDSTSPILVFDKNRFLGSEEAIVADNDVIGTIQFTGTNDNMQVVQYGEIMSQISESSQGNEAGKLTLSVNADSTSTQSPGLILEGEHATAGEVDVTIANGASSTTTIAGKLAVTTGTPTTIASGNQATLGIPMIARRTITQAEMNNLHTTPITIIPAQGANLVAIPISCNVFVDRATNNTSGSHFIIGYDSPAFTNSIFFSKSFHYNVSTDAHYLIGPYSNNWGASMTVGVNTAVDASANAAHTTNCFTSVDVYITYYVIDRS